MGDIVRQLGPVVDSPKTDSTRLTPRLLPQTLHGLEYAQDMERRQFTLEESNALVPWMEETFQRLAGMREEQTNAQAKLDELLKRRGSNGSSSSNEAMQQAQGDVDRLARLLEEGLQDILAQGIIVRDVATGLVDFPSQREGREVFLCWIGGEESIGFWHETNRGFAHRQPL